MSVVVPVGAVGREELYKAVWEAPAVQLAKHYGVSDVAIAKACKAMGIPKPPPGYWQRRRSGQEVCPPLLPELMEGQRPWYQFYPGPAPEWWKSVKPSEAKKRAKDRRAAGNPRDSVPTVAVPATLENASKLVKDALKLLPKVTADERSILKLPDVGSVDVRVSEPMMDRALCVFEALRIALNQLDYQLMIDESGRTGFRVAKEFVQVRIFEKTHRVPFDPKRHVTNSWSRRQYWLEPEGKLSVQLDHPVVSQRKRTWVDDRKGKLDEQLPSVLQEVLRLPGRIEAWRVWMEEEERKRVEQERRRAAEHRTIVLNAMRGKEVARRLDELAEIERLNARLPVLERMADGENSMEWIVWAKQWLESRMKALARWPAFSDLGLTERDIEGISRDKLLR